MRFGHHAAAENLGINPGLMTDGVTQSLDHEHRGPFAHHEAAAVAVEGAASLRRIIVIRQHAHAVEAGCKQRVNPLGAAGQGDVGFVVVFEIARDRGQPYQSASPPRTPWSDNGRRTVQSKPIGHRRSNT